VGKTCHLKNLTLLTSSLVFTYVITQESSLVSVSSPTSFARLNSQPKSTPTQPAAPRFGEHLNVLQKPFNIVLDTAESGPEVRLGGLSVISEQLRRTLTHHIDNVSVTEILAYLNPLRAHDLMLKRQGRPHEAFQPTGLTIDLHIPENGPGSKDSFKILQQFIPKSSDVDKPIGDQKGTLRFAIDNDTYFHANDLYTYTPSEKTSGKQAAKLVRNTDPAFAKNMIRARVTAALLPYLQGKPLPNGSSLKTLNGKIDMLVANDWMSGPIFREMSALNDSSLSPTKVFYLHNNHSADRTVKLANNLGMALPTESELLYPTSTPHEKSEQVRTGMYSPLALGIHDANIVIGNKNYVKTLTETPFAQGQAFRDILLHKSQNGLISDMHHAPAARFNPQTNLDLLKDGFRQLGVNETDMTAFKQHNKLALQKELGLREDPDAVVMAWMARLEPRQKGFNMLADTIVDALKNNSHLQFVVWGDVSKDDVIQTETLRKVLQAVHQNPALRDRLYLPNQFAKGATEKRIAQTYAGSNFVILPSMWEPYGLTQLEAMQMGAIPLVHGVDGIRSTVSDPLWNHKSWIPSVQEAAEKGKDKEKAWEYGQTGVMMEPVPVFNYLQAMDRSNEIDNLNRRLHQQPTAFAQAGKREPVTLEELTQAAKRVRQALDEGHDAPLAQGVLPTVLSDKERNDLEEILSRPVFDQALRAGALRPAELKRKLNFDELKTVRADVKMMKNIFESKDRGMIDSASNKFRVALDRAVNLDESDCEQIRQNGRRYLAENHSEEAIVKQRYIPAFEHAVSAQKAADEPLPAYEEPPPAYTKTKTDAPSAHKSDSKAPASPFVQVKKSFDKATENLKQTIAEHTPNPNRPANEVAAS
jgi:glycogen synthase